MSFQTEFIPLQLDQLRREAAVMKADGWRFIQTHAVNGEAGVDLYYSFMKDGRIVNYRIAGVREGDAVPSITDLFLAAFVFENEARELFGVDMRDIAIDFDGAMYAPAEQSPMTFISPQQKAARDKARKVAAAKAAKAAQPAVQGAIAKAAEGFTMTPERQAKLDAKMAAMAPEKRAKVEAALRARMAKASQGIGASAADGAPSQGGDAGGPATSQAGGGASEAQTAARRVSPDAMSADKQLQSLMKLMDDSKAKIVRHHLSKKGGE